MSDVEYYRRRAVAERRLAEAAENSDVAAIHEELAIQYEALVAEAAIRPTLHIRAPGTASSHNPARR